MKVFFAAVGVVGLVLVMVSYWQRNAPADAWPHDWDRGGTGLIMTFCAAAGEIILHWWP